MNWLHTLLKTVRTKRKLHAFVIFSMVSLQTTGFTPAATTQIYLPLVANPAPPQGLWTSKNELASLPTSGAAWDRLKTEADLAATTPTLGDQDSDVNTIVLAKALVYARTGTAKYRDQVVAALNIITYNNTENGGRTLAVGRKLAAYVIAADLINLSSYNASLDAAFRAKLRELLDKPFEAEVGKKNLRETHEKRPNNWGTHAGASRIAVALYLGDKVELAQAAAVFHGYLGNHAAYDGFNFGDDLSWQADPAHPVGINPPGATKNGQPIDGVMPDDMRRGGPFQAPPAFTGYPWEALQGAVVQAELLERAGYPAWSWENNALLRAVQYLYRVGWTPQADDRWIPCLINHAYRTNLPIDPEATPGKNMGFACWTAVGR